MLKIIKAGIARFYYFCKYVSIKHNEYNLFFIKKALQEQD
jgi:hypothetical protein